MAISSTMEMGNSHNLKYCPEVDDGFHKDERGFIEKQLKALKKILKEYTKRWPHPTATQQDQEENIEKHLY